MICSVFLFFFLWKSLQIPKKTANHTVNFLLFFIEGVRGWGLKEIASALGGPTFVGGHFQKITVYFQKLQNLTKNQKNKRGIHDFH